MTIAHECAYDEVLVDDDAFENAPPTHMAMSLRPYSATGLALGGMILMILGQYFVFVRPPLLPEDPRYMGSSIAQIQVTVPGLLILRRGCQPGAGNCPLSLRRAHWRYWLG